MQCPICLEDLIKNNNIINNNITILNFKCSASKDHHFYRNQDEYSLMIINKNYKYSIDTFTMFKETSFTKVKFEYDLDDNYVYNLEQRITLPTMLELSLIDEKFDLQKTLDKIQLLSAFN